MTGIRPARPEDAERLRALDVATWSPLVSPGPRQEPTTPFFGERTDPADVLVAEADGEVSGFVVLRQSSAMPSHAHVLMVNGLAVDPGRQGQGIGRLLVEAARHEAGRRGARKLSLRVLSTNESARRLYESCGFAVEGVLRAEFVLEGREVDDVLMAVSDFR